MPEKTVCENLGQAYIKNKSKTNSSFEKEQDYHHHQGIVADDDNNPVLAFTPQKAKEFMRYDDLLGEALTWGELKAMLGHFASDGDKTRCISAKLPSFWMRLRVKFRLQQK